MVRRKRKNRGRVGSAPRESAVIEGSFRIALSERADILK